jgi:hypothetical protein
VTNPLVTEHTCWIVLTSDAGTGSTAEPFQFGSHISHIPCISHLNISLPAHLNGCLNIFSHSIWLILKYYWIYFMLLYGLWHHSLINCYWHLDKQVASICPEDVVRIFLQNVGNLPEYDVTTHTTIAQVLTAMKTSNLILICCFAAGTDSDAADNYCVYIHCYCLQLL